MAHFKKIFRVRQAVWKFEQGVQSPSWFASFDQPDRLDNSCPAFEDHGQDERLAGSKDAWALDLHELSFSLACWLGAIQSWSAYFY